LDVLLLALFLPKDVAYAMHRHDIQKPWMRWVTHGVRIFAVDHSDPMAMKSLIHYVQEGHQVVIFPEGRMTATGALMKVYPAPGMIADKAQADILPIRIDGAQYSHFSHLRGKLRLRWFPKIRLTVLPPQRLQFPDTMTGRERRNQAGKVLADIMSDMVFETSDYHRRIWDALLEAVEHHGHDYVILEDVERTPMSYRQMLVRSFILGDLLQGLAQEDAPVGVLLPNTSAGVLTLLGLQSRGMIPAMLNYTMGERAAVGAVHTAGIQTVVTARAFIEKAELQTLEAALAEHVTLIYLEDLRENLTLWGKLSAVWSARYARRAIHQRLASVASSDTALILFTSGSEGVPKGVALSHENLLANVAQIQTRIAIAEDDVCLSALPMFHSFGMTGGVLLPLLSGMRLFLYTSPLHYRVIPEIAYDINATVLFGTNVFLAGYAKHADPYDFYSMRYVIAGAEKLQDATRNIWVEKFGIRILEGYGATETSPVLAVNTPMHYKEGSVGRLLPGIAYRLEHVPGIEGAGLLWVRGANIMQGYLLHDGDGTVQAPEDGWYNTGDMVHIDADGFVHIRGRIKRFAKIAGEMVSLTAVEDMARHCWAEGMHVALAVQDAQRGEQLVLMSNMEGLARSDLLAYAAQHGIQELQVPRKFVYVSEIPLMGSGKVHYSAAQALLESLL